MCFEQKVYCGDAAGFRELDKKSLKLFGQMRLAKRRGRSPNASDGIKKLFNAFSKLNRRFLIEAGKNPKLKRLKRPRYADVDSSVLGWLKYIRSENLPVTGDLLQVFFNDPRVILGFFR